MRRLRFFALLLALIGCSLTSRAQQSTEVDGMVFDQANHRGIENLEVRMTPPSSVSLPVRLAHTEQNGSFHFPQVRTGRYLLEVSQGPNLLYRVQVDTATQNHLQVPLQRR